MNNNLISVIVPVYNMEKYLPICIDSIINQTYSNIEILLVNDGSTDSCREICDLYRRKDSRILIINKENGGLSSARNCGIKHSNGDWIAFVDADDWIEPMMLEKLMDMAIASDASVAVCRYYREYQNASDSSDIEESEKYVLSGSEIIAEGYLISRYLSPIVMNKLYRNDLFFDEFLFPEGRNFEDIPLTTKIIKRGERIVFTGEKYYHYRQRNNSIIHSKSIKNQIDNWISREERYKELKDFLPIEYSQILICECITAIYKMWNLLLQTNKKKEYKGSIDNMITFAKNHFKTIKSSDYPIDIKIMVSLARYNNIVSYAIVAVMKKIQTSYNWIKGGKSKMKLFE